MNGLSRRNQRLVAKDVEIFTKKCQSTPSSSSVLVTHEGSKEVFRSTEGRVEHLFLSADARGSVCPLHVRPHILDEAVFLTKRKREDIGGPGRKLVRHSPPGLTKRQNEKCPREAVKKEFSDTSSDNIYIYMYCIELSISHIINIFIMSPFWQVFSKGLFFLKVSLYEITVPFSGGFVLPDAT